jgi:hypothetical protein
MPHQSLGVRIEQKLVPVEAVARIRRVRPVHAVGVDRARAEVAEVTVPDLVGVLEELDPLELPLALVVEEAELDAGRVGGKEREVHPEPVPGGAKGVWAAFGQPGA